MWAAHFFLLSLIWMDDFFFLLVLLRANAKSLFANFKMENAQKPQTSFTVFKWQLQRGRQIKKISIWKKNNSKVLSEFEVHFCLSEPTEYIMHIQTNVKSAPFCSLYDDVMFARLAGSF